MASGISAVQYVVYASRNAVYELLQSARAPHAIPSKWNPSSSIAQQFRRPRAANSVYAPGCGRNATLSGRYPRRPSGRLRDCAQQVVDGVKALESATFTTGYRLRGRSRSRVRSSPRSVERSSPVARQSRRKRSRPTSLPVQPSYPPSAAKRRPTGGFSTSESTFVARLVHRGGHLLATWSSVAY